ncbi:MAG: hypothetical protein KFW21_06505 [Spirochaetota bacterium]|nr:hypothetical protein [Spirochaetota bacterium]
MKITKYILLLIIIQITSISFSQTTESVNVQLEQVQQHITDKNYALGISILTVLIQENPNDNNIYRAYAELLLSFRHYDDATTNIQKAILLSKDNPSNYVIEGNIYRAQKKYTNAQTSYAHAIKLSPNMGEAYSEFSLLNLQYRFIQDAERLAKLAYHYSPNSWQNIILRAKIAQQNNNSTLAQKIFLEGVRRFPYNENLLDAFAEFYISNKEYNKASVILKEVNIRFGDSILRNNLLGDLLFSQSNYTEALKYYELIDQIYAELPIDNIAILKWKLYNLYQITNNTNKSNESLQKAFELDPTNQLYISAFYNYLLSTDNTALKTMFSKYLEKLATQERGKGLGHYYLSLLKKIFELDPSNTKVRNSLIDYAKIKNDQHLINQLLKENIKQDTNNTLITKIITLRNHLTKTKKLDTNQRRSYQYTNKIFITDSSCKIGSSIQKELKDLEFFYPNIIFSVELEKDFKRESKTIFQNNTNYNLVIDMVINQDNSVLNIEVFDKKGLLINYFKHAFSTQILSENLINLVLNISQMLPPIGYINTRLANSTFNISLGSTHLLTTNSIVTILDKNFVPLTTATITSITPYSATVKQNMTPRSIIDIESAFVIPIEFIPSLDTNTIQSTNIIKNINQISQIRHATTVDFSTTDNN